MGTAFVRANIASAAWATANWGTPAKRAIIAASATAGTFLLDPSLGDKSAEFPTGQKFAVTGSTSGTNDGNYVASADATYSEGVGTTLTVASVAADDTTGDAQVQPRWPGDTGANVADTVSCTVANAPTDGPAAPLTIASYTCSGSNFDPGTNLTVTGTVTIGTLAGSDAPAFSGTATGATCIARGGAIFKGTGGNWTMLNDAYVGVAGVAQTVAGTLSVNASWSITGGDYSAATITIVAVPAEFDDSDAPALVLPATVNISAANVVLTGGGSGISGGPNFRLTSDTASIRFSAVTTINPKIITNAGANQAAADVAEANGNKAKILSGQKALAAQTLTGTAPVFTALAVGGSIGGGPRF